MSRLGYNLQHRSITSPKRKVIIADPGAPGRSAVCVDRAGGLKDLKLLELVHAYSIQESGHVQLFTSHVVLYLHSVLEPVKCQRLRLVQEASTLR